MIKDDALVRKFEKTQSEISEPDYFRNLRVFEELYLEAKNLGIFPLKDPLEGIDVDIRVARVLNVRKTT